MRLSKLVQSEDWLNAARIDDAEAKTELLNREITAAMLTGDESEVYSLTYYKFRACRSNPAVAYPILELLEAMKPPQDEDLSILVARILWEEMSDASSALRWLDRAQIASMPSDHNNDLVPRDTDWWAFISLGIRLGALYQLGAEDGELMEILCRLQRFIYLGNLCQDSLLKSLRIVIQAGSEQRTGARVSSATMYQAKHLLWWIWADAKRQERFTPDTVYDAVNIVETLLRSLESEKK